jgi:hypothetical protein
MDFLKTVGGKVASGLVMLAVGAAALAWFETDQPVRDHILQVIGHLLAWTALVLVLPWAGFMVIGRVGKMDSNAAGAVLVLALTAVEATALAWAFGWSVHGPSGWIMFLAAVLIAGVYNLFTCDWIAEQTE